MREDGACFEATWEDDTPVEQVRFVVLDSETTGLDPKKDRLVTIGAVAVERGEIVLEDSFEAMLKVAHNTSAVTVHGVTREQSLQGLEEPEALERFLDYLRDGVIVGHHIGHDIETLNAGYERHFGSRLKNRSLDTMELALHLERTARSRAGGDPELFAGCAVRHVRSDSARPAHGVGGRVHHRAGVSAAAAAGHAMRAHDAGPADGAVGAAGVRLTVADAHHLGEVGDALFEGAEVWASSSASAADSSAVREAC